MYFSKCVFLITSVSAMTNKFPFQTKQCSALSTTCSIAMDSPLQQTHPLFFLHRGWLCIRDPLKYNTFPTKYGTELARLCHFDPIFNPFSNNQRNGLAEPSLSDPETGNIFSAQFTQSRKDPQRFPCCFGLLGFFLVFCHRVAKTSLAICVSKLKESTYKYLELLV